jgi:hypothetical protein
MIRINLLLPFLFFAYLAINVNNQVFAQQGNTVTATFSNTPFKEFVQTIESQTKYVIYFNGDWTDSLFVTLQANHSPVKEVLQQALKETNLFSTIVDDKIFITKGRGILTQLPEAYQNSKSHNREVEQFDYSAYENRQKEIQKLEERLYNIGTKSDNLTGTATIGGTVVDAKSGEALVGISVFIENPLIGALTDQYGRYSITIPKGRHTLYFKSIGMKDTYRQIMLYNNGKLDVEMDEAITPLKEVVIESDRDARVTSLKMGTDKLDIKTMRNMPLGLGETDIMKVVLTLPGVQTVGEGTSGINVRGGATNQNLILYNNAVVYNPSHLFGFFSTFNPDVLKNVELFKSGIEAVHGGRLSSVLEVQTREGNLKKLSGSGGISPITARLSLEGPIQKDKTSFLLGYRTTYSDWILDRINISEMKHSSAGFYDINASISHHIDEDNSIRLSLYASRDRFQLESGNTYQYSDRNGSLTWKKTFNSKMYATFTGAVSNYQYSLSDKTNEVNAFDMTFSILQGSGKADFTYSLNSRHTLTAGLHVTRYGIAPGKIEGIGNKSEIIPVKLQQEQAYETAIYLGDNFDVTPNLTVYAGLRYSLYQNRGPRDVYQYSGSRDVSSIIDTVHYDGAIKTYHGAEPRISMRYSLTNSSSIKFSVNRMRQYVQMLSNTTAITPTDIWKLSDTYIPPQIGDQISLGFYKNLRGHTIETSAEAYYKTMKNTIDFKDGANLLLNHHIETDVVPTEGKAYGIELLVRKPNGKLNGWISYTYSRSQLKTTSTLASETINRGEYYASSYDKPHAANFVGNYKFSRRVNISLNMTYSTGRPITLPIAKYELDNSVRIYYSDRNAYRIPDYFRTDFSINIEGNHKVKKLAHSSWTFAVYNLTGRKNAYSVFFRTEGAQVKGYQLSIFGSAIPTITYNFKF